MQLPDFLMLSIAIITGLVGILFLLFPDRIRRLEAWGGLAESANGTTVESVEALLLWLFVDVAADRMATPQYAAAVEAWEEGLIRLVGDEARDRDGASIRVYAKVSLQTNRFSKS